MIVVFHRATIPARRRSTPGLLMPRTFKISLQLEQRNSETPVSLQWRIHKCLAYFNTGPLPWLMNKEFLSKFTMHHAVLKASPSFMGGRLHNRFVSTACPDPFCGDNGPASKGCVAVFCTSSGAGAALQHYHIPAKDLSPAPLRKKGQQCLVLDGDSRGAILTIAKCNIKKNIAEIAITAKSSLTLRFDQICLVQQAHIR